MNNPRLSIQWSSKDKYGVTIQKIENALVLFFQVVIVATVLGVIALYAVDAWIKEDNERVMGLEERFYAMALARSYAPAPPSNVRPNFGDLSEPKTRVFQDASRQASSGMGYDVRRAERGRR